MKRKTIIITAIIILFSIELVSSIHIGSHQSNSFSATHYHFDKPKPYYYTLPQGNCKVVFSTESKGFSPSQLSFSESNGVAERNLQSGTTGLLMIDEEFYTIKVDYSGSLDKPIQMQYFCNV